MPAPPVRVVVRLPWNRPEQPPNDPPRIDWTPEKADILWKVIEKSRTSDNSGTDWKGLAAHLQVPLPYLLYRVHARFQEELRGLQDIPGVLSPSGQSSAKSLESPVTETHSVAMRAVTRAAGSGRLSASGRMSTPLGIRARLNSLGSNYSSNPRKPSSSSMVTVQGTPKHQPLSATSPSPPDSDSEDEADLKEEETEREAEEQDALDRKLQELQRMMTNEAIGLVSQKRKDGDRGRLSSSMSSSRQDNLSRSGSQSISSSNSPPGSIPDIPSPPPDSHSPMGRHIPPALSPRSAIGQSHRRYGSIHRPVSEQGSSQGSQASSFSDISDASLSASALDSALMSNIRGNGSRISAFTKSRFGRASNVPRN
ncbi:hypothetical protein C8J56DRAFT_935709 [Mycena floridula]|nr:hypothetical protein C8J56DRAFT_935709 [Mycena floridula]